MTTVGFRWRALRSRGTEAGSGGGMTLMLLIASFALLVVVGLVVDGGSKAAGLGEATRLADEAARSAVQIANLNGGELAETAARTEVDRYLRSTDATSWTITTQGNTVTVTVTITRPTRLLTLMRVNSWTVTGTGRADGVYGDFPSN